ISALAVRLGSPGPVLFRQRRIGQYGDEIEVLKFRTLPAGHIDDTWNASNDDYNTVGRWLRRLSVDELPQLWNVLIGDMSLVGPRPPLPEEVSRYEEWHRHRLEVSPGLTGVWQVSGRSEIPFDEMVLMDLWYAENWSLGLDLKILLKTIP